MTMQRVVPLLILLCLCTSGCVRRTLRITSTPPGALIWINHREAGRTPLEIDFTYYGHYDVQLSLDGHEPMLTTAQANPPVWDVIGLDFVFEVAPFQSHSVVDWHFDLEERSNDLGALVERAQELRQRTRPDEQPAMKKVTVDKDGEVEPAPEAPETGTTTNEPSLR